MTESESVLDRLTALVGPAEIRYPDNIEIRRDRLRDLIAVARAAQTAVRNGARMPPSDPPLLPDEISALRDALDALCGDER